MPAVLTLPLLFAGLIFSSALARGGEVGSALERRIALSQAAYPGIAAEGRGGDWRVAIPDALRTEMRARRGELLALLGGETARTV